MILPLPPRTASTTEEHLPWEHVAEEKYAVVRDVQPEGRSIVVRVVAPEGMRHATAGAESAIEAVESCVAPMCTDIHAVGFVNVAPLLVFVGLVEVEESWYVAAWSGKSENQHGHSH